MNREIANKIKSGMKNFLRPKQMEKLNEVLDSILAEQNGTTVSQKDRKNLVRQFSSAKRIEGCSKRTEEYYFNTLKFFEKKIACDICSVTTNDIREYLINYQKINNCSNVTLDTVRRILSSFYKWLEEEDFILKSPMRRQGQ